MEKIILGAGVLNLFLGVLALQKGKRTKEIIAFGIFCIITGIWCFTNFLIYYSFSIFFLKLAYAFGALTVAALLSWSFFYNDRLKKYWIHGIIYLIGAGVAVFSMIDQFVVGEVRSVTRSGIDADEGRFFLIFSTYLFLMIIWSIINVFLSYRQCTGVKKHQARLVLIGISSFMLVTLLVSGILPTLGILGFTNLDSPSSLIFVLFTMVAVVRHKLLGTKVIWAQILVGILVTTSLIQLFGSQGPSEYATNAISLMVVLIVGIFLVRSVMTEAQHHDELEATTEQLSTANGELRRLNVVKSEFVSIASHQLRTPLGSMRWSMELLLNGDLGKLPKDAKEAVQQLYDNSQRLVTLVNDLLSIARIEQNLGSEEKEFVNIAEIMKAVQSQLQAEADKRNIKILMGVPEQPLLKILVSPKHIHQALENLLSNAIKYNRDNGTITIKIAEKEKYLELMIKDTGIGIPKEDQLKIFFKFFRASNAVLKETEGSGLGLSVVKSYLEESQARISFESEENVGTTFIVEFPLDPTAGIL